jgi:hypothetical protein
MTTRWPPRLFAHAHRTTGWAAEPSTPEPAICATGRGAVNCPVWLRSEGTTEQIGRTETTLRRGWGAWVLANFARVKTPGSTRRHR